MISFVETKLFTRLVQEYLSDDDYAKLQQALLADPEAGAIIPGSGGVRKPRMKLLAKSDSKRDIGLEILEGLRELKRGEIGRAVNVPSVAFIRERTGLSQTKFAALLGVSVRTLQEWEQGRRAPSGAARTLLMVAAKNPQVLLEVA